MLIIMKKKINNEEFKRETEYSLYRYCRYKDKVYTPMFNTHEKIRKFDRFVVDVYAYNWGIIIPGKTGICFEQQTGGVSCNHVIIEGTFIPLNKPYCQNKIHKHKNNEFLWKKDNTDLLAALQQANYHHNGSKKSYELVEKLWNEIKEVLHFDFKIIDIEPDNDEPQNQEGILWIEFTKFDSGWGHGDWVEKLIGKKVCLIFPNCD